MVVYTTKAMQKELSKMVEESYARLSELQKQRLRELEERMYIATSYLKY
ncbi:hypothetical protein HYV87_04675 [Candidatus Woesearchaeota archaeon]|nr:hypothetical protein [Candidatus Woesearchaeota archaeon]